MAIRIAGVADPQGHGLRTGEADIAVAFTITFISP